MAEEPPAGRHFRIIPLICASLTIALGLLTFIGWIWGLPLLASVWAKYIPMAPSTALCFSLIGIGTVAHIWNSTLRWSRQRRARKAFDDDVCVVGMEVQHTG